MTRINLYEMSDVMHLKTNFWIVWFSVFPRLCFYFRIRNPVKMFYFNIASFVVILIKYVQNSNSIFSHFRKDFNAILSLFFKKICNINSFSTLYPIMINFVLLKSFTKFWCYFFCGFIISFIYFLLLILFHSRANCSFFT